MNYINKNVCENGSSADFRSIPLNARYEKKNIDLQKRSIYGNELNKIMVHVIYENGHKIYRIKYNSLSTILIMFIAIFLVCIYLTFIHAALDKEDLSCPTFKFTKSYLNTAHHSFTYWDTLPRRPLFFGKKRKRNAF